MLKHFIIRNLHSLFGFENYLFFFSLFKIFTLNLDKRKKEYVYFSKIFEKDSNILIIGANTGITTVPVAKTTVEGKVFAVEPVPVNYRTLERVIKYFNQTNVITLNMALGNKSGTIDMFLPIINKTRSHGLAYIKDESIEGFQEGIKYNVDIWKLDDLELIQDVKISGIKVVAENYEKFIFEGGEKFINKNKPLIYCELWFNENRIKTLSLIRSWNYEIKVLENNSLIPYISSKHKTKNLFFVPA